MRWGGLAASLALAACVPQLTGAPCHEDDNCPVNQYCDGTNCQSGTPPATRIVQLLVTTPAGILPLGATVQATATAVLQSGATEDVTGSATWSSTDTRVAEVSNDAGTQGTVLAVATGEVNVMAVLGTNSGSAHLVVTDAQLVSLVVTVDRPVVAARTDVACTAVGFFTDGTHADLTSFASWTSTQPGVVSVSASPGSVGALVALSPGTAVVSATYQQLTDSTSINVTDATLLGLSIAPLLPWVGINTSVGLQATGLFSDGTAQPMTGSVQWTVDDPSLAFFLTSVPGELQGFSAGSTSVQAQANTLSVDVPLVVSDAALASLAVSPMLPGPIGIGSNTTFTAWATYADQGVLDVSTQSSWSSSAPDILAIFPGSGSASALDAGTGSAEVAFGDTTAMASQTVDGAAPSELMLWPPSASLTVGLPTSLAAERVLADGTVDDVTLLAGWNSSCPAEVQLATGTLGGDAVARSSRNCSASARFNGLSGSASVMAVSRALARVEVSPGEAAVGPGGWAPFTATAIYLDGALLDVTALAAWTSANPGTVVAGNGAQAGQVLALDAGVSAVTASFGGSTATAQVSVGAALPQLEVWPPLVSLHAGTALVLRTTAVWPGGDAVDVTPWTVLASTDASVASVANASSAPGALAALASGTAEVTALFGPVLARAVVVVDEASAQSLTLEGPSALPVGEVGTFQATAQFSDGSGADVTGQASWTSSAPAAVRLRGTGPSRGAAAALAAGSAQAQAWFGAATGSLPVTSSPGGLQALSIQGVVSSLPAGVQLQLIAAGSYPNGVQLDVTRRAVWTSVSQAVAVVSNGPSAGLLEARAAGTTQLTVAFEGMQATASIVVSAATLTGLTILPASPSGAVGVAVPLQAQGTFSDGSNFDLTRQARWASDNPAGVAVSNAPQYRGTAMALMPGTATLSASVLRPDNTPVSGSAAFVAQPAALVGVEIVPASITLSLGGEDTVALRARGHFSDGTTEDVSPGVNWSVQNTAVAAVTASGALTGLKEGTTNVLAQVSTVVGSASVNVTP